MDKLSWISILVVEQKENLQSSIDEREGAQAKQYMGVKDLWQGYFS